MGQEAGPLRKLSDPDDPESGLVDMIDVDIIIEAVSIAEASPRMAPRQSKCPKCGDANAIYRDELDDQWACRMCGWRSGKRPAVPLTPDPPWPHNRLWTHKD